MKPKVLKNEEEYDAALAVIDALLNAPPGSPEADDLELWSQLVELYEEEHYPMALPDPITAIRFRMEQQGLKQSDLVPYFGSKSKVSEVLNGKRPLSLAMIRKLHNGLGIPAEVLIGEENAALDQECEGVDWDAFPHSEMVKRGWFDGLVDSGRELQARAEEVLAPFLRLAGPLRPQAVLARQHVRQGSEVDEHALWAWSARVAQLAHEREVADVAVTGRATEFMKDVAGLSFLDDGPRLAREFLAKNGICMVVEPHLPKTHLDGAAFRFENLPPVVALTLRHDRIDAFWFTLCHEVAHVLLHLGDEEGARFIDDLDLADTSEMEIQADDAARQALIDDEAWREFQAEGPPSRVSITQFARRLRVHPAIVAGRYRREANNYKAFSDMVGNRQVRQQFELS